MRTQEDIYYYITVMNENYPHPEMPAGAEEGILKGMYLFREGSASDREDARLRVQLLGSGTILREVIAAAEILEKEYGVTADIWSVTSFNELRREALDVARWNMLHPRRTGKVVLCGHMPERSDRARGGRHGLYENIRRSDTRVCARAI